MESRLRVSNPGDSGGREGKVVGNKSSGFGKICLYGGCHAWHMSLGVLPKGPYVEGVVPKVLY